MAAHRFLVQLLLLITLRTPEAQRQSSLDPGRVHAVLRFAFGVTLAFVASELLEWIPTFLAPVLVAVVLVNVPVRPPLKVGVGLIVIIAAAALIALFLCAVLRGAPALLFGATALVVFLALHAIAKGRPRIAPILLLICVTAIPVVALQSESAANAFAVALVRSMCFAILIVWITYLLWPRVTPPRPAASAVPLSPELALKSALLGTAILTPLMLVYLMFGIADALPVLIGSVMIVANLDFRSGRKQAVALVIGNTAGGIASLALFLLLVLNPSVVTLTLILLVAALAFGWRITAGDPMAAVVLVAFNAMMIVFSLSLLSDSGTFSIWVTRLTQFMIAGAFAIGMMALLWPRNDKPAQKAPTSTDA